MLTMNVDFNVILTGLLAPVAVLAVKTLLDFSLAHVFVKYFSWIPIRGIFRDKPPVIAGHWENVWGAAGSEDFRDAIDRHSTTEIKQFGRYCYCEYRSRGIKYGLFGRIRGMYLIGEWYDITERTEYFGTSQLRIIDGTSMEGKYVGHSRKTCQVQQDEWNWRKHGP